MIAGVPLILSDTPGISTVPSSGCSSSRRIPLAAMVSPPNQSARVRTGPLGTSAAASNASHSARVLVRNAASSMRVVTCTPGATNAALEVARDLRIRQQLGEHAGDLQRPHVERFEQRPEEEPFAVRALIEAIVRRAAEGRTPDRAILLLEPRRRQDLRGAVQPADHHALPESRAHALEQCRADRGGQAVGLAVVGQRRDEVDGRAGVRRLPDEIPVSAVSRLCDAGSELQRPDSP